eukprot:3245008-Rhodomonas_salina.1
MITNGRDTRDHVPRLYRMSARAQKISPMDVKTSGGIPTRTCSGTRYKIPGMHIGRLREMP